MNILIMGPAGAGKGTMSELILKEYDIPHISTGDMLRENVRNNTELGKLAKSYMEAGKLVPDELTCDLVVDRIAKEDCAKGYILDGFPRTIPQAEALTKALAKDGGAIDYAIDVDVPDSDIVRRLSGRRACLKCGATYHTSFNPPRVEGICDSCGEALVHRDDDKPETIQKRLDVYHSQTQPLIEYYHEAGCMYKVDGTRSLEDVFASICAILE